MLNRILGEKNSIKRTIMSFSLCFVFVTMVLGSMIVLQTYTATKQYDAMLQNIVSLEDCKSFLGQIQLSSKKYAETRNEWDLTLFRTNREALEERLNTVEAVSSDPSSLVAVQRIRALLSQMNELEMKVRSGETDYGDLAPIDVYYENTLYLLNRVQNLEISYAADAYPQMRQTMMSMTKVALVILALMLVETILLFTDLSAKIYEPIRRLVSGVGEISRGNFTQPDIQIEGTNELDYLATAINGMKKDLSQLFTTVQEKLNAERLLKEAQFLALQSQVNPHFLFNTLGMAIQAALVEGADKTVDIMESISYMLRYSLRSMKTNVSLRDEMHMVQTYLFLQGKRFGDRIVFQVDADDAVLDVMIPGMTVQPLVENAMIHGCEKMESGGWLRVRCAPDAAHEYVIVTVENNGGVISEAQRQAFSNGESIPHSGKSTGIGLANVRDRMQYFYDRKGLVDCAVVDGTINMITLRYPMDVREA